MPELNPETLKLMKESAQQARSWNSKEATDFKRHCNPANVSALIAEYERLKDEAGELRDIVDALADTGKCHYDHRGYCQEHLWFKSDVECPHARAQRLWDTDGNELPVVTEAAQQQAGE